MRATSAFRMMPNAVAQAVHFLVLAASGPEIIGPRSAIAEIFEVSETALRRGVSAWKAGTEIGENGKPTALSAEDEEVLAAEVVQAEELRAPLKLREIQARAQELAVQRRTRVLGGADGSPDMV